MSTEHENTEHKNSEHYYLVEAFEFLAAANLAEGDPSGDIMPLLVGLRDAIKRRGGPRREQRGGAVLNTQ